MVAGFGLLFLEGLWLVMFLRIWWAGEDYIEKTASLVRWFIPAPDAWARDFARALPCACVGMMFASLGLVMSDFETGHGQYSVRNAPTANITLGVLLIGIIFILPGQLAIAFFNWPKWLVPRRLRGEKGIAARGFSRH